jgi:hypothetical protein
LLHATIFPGSDFLFSQDSISKSVASDGPHDQCWSNCTPANALHVLSNRTQGKWLSFFARQHLISPAKVFSKLQRRRVIHSAPEVFLAKPLNCG